MKHKFNSYALMTAFCERTQKTFRRETLLGAWNKWRRGTLLGTVELCDHEDTLSDWDCGCSHGCDSCKCTTQCDACGSLFNQRKNVPCSVTLTPIPAEHTCECRTCGKPFDKRDLDQVFAHEHDGAALATGIQGQRVTDD